MDKEFEEIVKATIDKSVSVGGELMRRQVLALLDQQVRRQVDGEVLTVLHDLIEQVGQIRV